MSTGGAKATHRLVLYLASLIVAVAAVVSIATAGQESAPRSIHLIRPHAAGSPRSLHSTSPTITTPAASAGTPAPPSVTLAKLVGQQLMVRMDGTTPDPGILARIRAGEVGGVILYGENIVSPAQTASVVHELQDAARQGGNPPLLISVDQEGGEVVRLPWAAPRLSAEALGAAGQVQAGSEGLQTGTDLRAVGINVDLAPVVDVAHSPDAFIWRQERSFGMDPASVAATAGAFAQGLQQAGVAATAKHFPGLGGAPIDTDSALQNLQSGPGDIEPYRSLIADNVAMIMVSTGVFPGLDPSGAPAALSRTIATGLLRNQLGFDGVIITDDLERPTGFTVPESARRATAAGADMILMASTEGAGRIAYGSLLSAARSGITPMSSLTDSYLRILELKRRYATSS
jgi:beta-N-acetylhexosaminidase